MVWRAEDPQGAESKKIKHLIVPYTRGLGLDLGCGPWKAWPHFIGVDNFDEWAGFEWRPDVPADCTNLSMFADASLNFVFSSHLLEHIENTEKTLREWWRVIRPDGHLVLYLPHKDFYPNIGEEGSNPDHKHDFLPADIVAIMERVGGWDLVENQDRNGGTEYSFLQVYRKTKGNKHAYPCRMRNPKQKPRCLVIRYGGFGDMIQASSVLPGLKEEGYHIVFNTTPRGHDVIRHDPHVDEFMIQDVDQVPNEELTEYWKALGPEYDRVINLCETIEGTLLAIPGRRNHSMSKRARHVLMDINYLEFTHAVADVPPPYRPHFYATAAERKEAADFRKKIGGAPVIVWTLTGSSIHKAWPWSGDVAAWLVEHTDARILYEGGRDTQVLEIAIAQALVKHFLDIDYEESHPMKLSELLARLKAHFGGNRIFCFSGRRTIRESMAFIDQADMMVGPETGMLNAASMMSVPKVVMLSHSSKVNLTRDWVNTTTIEPVGVDCYPCHRLHYDRAFCPEDEPTGAAACAASIRPERVFKAIMEQLSLRKVA